MGQLQYGSLEFKTIGLRQLMLRYQSYLLQAWNHTAKLTQMIYNLNATVANALGASPKLRPREAADFHPFLESKSLVTSIKAENITDLKQVALALRSSVVRIK